MFGSNEEDFDRNYLSICSVFGDGVWMQTVHWSLYYPR